MHLERCVNPISSNFLMKKTTFWFCLGLSRLALGQNCPVAFYTNPNLAGISNAVVHNNKIVVSAAHTGVANFPGYPDPNSQFYKLDLVRDDTTALAIESQSVADPVSMMKIAPSGNISLAYKKPIGSSFLFNARYQEYGASALVASENIFTSLNTAIGIQYNFATDGITRAVSFNAMGYYLAFHKRSLAGVWSNFNASGPGLEYWAPKTSIGNLDSLHTLVLLQNNGINRMDYFTITATDVLKYVGAIMSGINNIYENQYYQNKLKVLFSLGSELRMLTLNPGSAIPVSNIVVASGLTNLAGGRFTFRPDGRLVVAYQTTGLVRVMEETAAGSGVFNEIYINNLPNVKYMTPSLVVKNGHLHVVFANDTTIFEYDLDRTPLSASLVDSTAACQGAANGTATVAGTGGMPPYSFLWSDGQNNSTAINLAAASYTVTVTDKNACTFVVNVTIPEQLISPDCGLTSWYKMDGDINSPALADSSGNAYHFTAFGGVSSAQNRFGDCKKALYFDGTGHLTAGDVPLGHNGFAVSVWVKPEGEGYIFSKHATALDCELLVGITNGKYDFEWNINGQYIDGDIGPSGLGSNNGIGIATPTYNQFDHIVLTYDGLQIKFYVNNSLVKTINQTGLIFDNTIPLTIGTWATNPAISHFSGYMDDLRLYNRALSPTEITALYKAPPDYPAPADDLDCGLVADFRLDGNAVDSSSLANHGTVNGATPAQDRFGNCNKAMYFNNSWVTVPHHAALNFSGSFSMAFWYKKDGDFTGPAYLIGKGRDIENQYSFSGNLTSEGFALNNYPGNEGVFIGSSSSQVWHHAVCIYDKSSLKIQLFIDNQLATEKTTALIFSAVNTHPLVIGRHCTNPGGCGPWPYFFKGWMDDVRLYSRALSPTEITALYNAPPDYPTPADDLDCGLKAHLKMDGDAQDATGNGNHGTAQNTVVPARDRFENCNSAMHLTCDPGTFSNAGGHILLPPLLKTGDRAATVSIWAKTESICNPSGETIFSFGKDDATGTSGTFYVLLSNDSTIQFRTDVAPTNSVSRPKSTVFNHYLLSFGKGVATLYLDGQPVSTRPNSTIQISSDDAAIGRHWWYSTSTRFTGSVDDFRYYDRELSPTEVLQLFNETNPNDNPPPAAAVSTPNNATSNCQSLPLTAAPATGVTYQWLKDGTPIPGANSGSFTATESGSYQVLATKSTGCDSLSPALTITIHPLPVASVGADTVICAGAVVPIAAAAGTGYTYAWDNGAGNAQTSLVSPAATTTYSLTVTDANTCTATDQVTVTVNPAPSATVAPAGPVSGCSSTGLTLTASSNGPSPVFQWQKDGVDIPGATQGAFSPTMTGIYSVRVKNSFACENTSNFVQVTVNGLPPANISPGGPTSFCAGDNVLLASGLGSGYSFIWKKDGIQVGTTQNISASQTGLYTLEVTETATGCMAVSSGQQVTVWPLPTANAGTDATICAGKSTTLMASGGISYKWSSGATAAATTVSPSANTTYSVTVTDGNGCSSTDQVAVTVNPVPTANAGADATICRFENVPLTASGGGNYLWSNGSTNPNIMVSPATTTIFGLTVTNGFNCADTDSVKVTINPQPAVTAAPDQPSYCESKTAVISASGGQIYQWTKPGGQTVSGNPIVLTNLMFPADAGNYTVIGQDANGCKDTAIVQINLKPMPDVVISGLDTVCSAGLPIIWQASGADSYAWSIGGNNTGTLLLFSGGSFTVTATGANGCTAVATKKATVFTSPTVQISGEPIVCLGKPTLLTASPNLANFIWSNGSTSNQITVSPTTNTYFWVKGTSAENCTDIDSFKVEVRTAPVLSSLPDLTICADTVTLVGKLPNSYSIGAWTSPDLIPIQITGPKTAFAKDLNIGDNFFKWSVVNPPCLDTITAGKYAYFAGQKPVLALDTTFLLPTETLELDLTQNDNLPAIDNASWIYGLYGQDTDAGAWSLASNGILTFDPIDDFSGFALAQYRVENPYCPIFSDSAQIRVFLSGPIDDGDGETAITPGIVDGYNDELVFPYLDKYPKNEILIFDRWGSRIFSAKPYKNDWGGTYKGRPLPEGTYYYHLYLNTGDRFAVQRGSILLIRPRN